MQRPLPKSSTNLAINSIGLLGFFLTLFYLRSGTGLPMLWTMVCLIAGYALPIIVLERIFLQTHLNKSTGLLGPRAINSDRARVLRKLLALYAVVGSYAFLYWLLPEYNGTYYAHYYELLTTFMPCVLALAVPYFFYVDNKMQDPRDGYDEFGRWLLSLGSEGDTKKIKQLYLGWLVKAFFFPLMYTATVQNYGFLASLTLKSFTQNFQTFFDSTISLMYSIDVMVVVAGYMLTLRVFDSHVRSAEPTFFGWSVALVCYQPFAGFFTGNFWDYGLYSKGWGSYFYGTWVYPIWGSAILALVGIYMLATLCFGIRFSNLTHRGLITNGVYAYTKHPAYVAKATSWWLVSMPFMLDGGWQSALKGSALLGLICLMYFLRARTEERHLGAFADYQDYALLMNERSVFAFMGRWFPALQFRVPQNEGVAKAEDPARREALLVNG